MDGIRNNDELVSNSGIILKYVKPQNFSMMKI